ncbi:conjugal transfer protein [Stenotrophomonas humi]|uniref:Conjugal transfer protein n=1 Tax=Stenotrophomonas humi TaxID=405444 RepID=A0A0R0C6L5_9GAMM|nr:TraX family protein [Stenotrophomonas humi]KRG61441.1 conjugal transfer protein [Stenotrophomonas humi]KRG64257.1 conjugal transfer protein [Stenotrophomonas humi]
MTSAGREILKWVAVLLMTGDHAAKLLYGGYVPVVSELGRIAFPVFALVMAYNLAQPGADVSKSVKRLAMWGLIAQPVYAWAFDVMLPVNVLLSFALAAACVLCAQNRRWWLVVLAIPMPLLVDYQWAGIVLVTVWWWLFATRRVDSHFWLGAAAFAPLCFYNGNAWALLALPVMALGQVELQVPRTRWAFYGYYVAHIGLLAIIS